MGLEHWVIWSESTDIAILVFTGVVVATVGVAGTVSGWGYIRSNPNTLVVKLLVLLVGLAILAGSQLMFHHFAPGV